jgi:DNA modification methylase
VNVLRDLPAGFVDCCVTSPPYFGLRDYGIDGQIGIEKDPFEYINNLLIVFREVHRTLKDDGTLWVIIADSYATSSGGLVSEAGYYMAETKRNAGKCDRPLHKIPRICFFTEQITAVLF